MSAKTKPATKALRESKANTPTASKGKAAAKKNPTRGTNR